MAVLRNSVFVGGKAGAAGGGIALVDSSAPRIATNTFKVGTSVPSSTCDKHLQALERYFMDAGLKALTRNFCSTNCPEAGMRTDLSTLACSLCSTFSDRNLQDPMCQFLFSNPQQGVLFGASLMPCGIDSTLH